MKKIHNEKKTRIWSFDKELEILMENLYVNETEIHMKFGKHIYKVSMKVEELSESEFPEDQWVWKYGEVE